MTYRLHRKLDLSIPSAPRGDGVYLDERSGRRDFDAKGIGLDVRRLQSTGCNRRGHCAGEGASTHAQTVPRFGGEALAEFLLTACPRASSTS